MCKRIVLTTFGSFGDLHPYMAIALELKARGHQPIIATSEIYRRKVEDESIGFHAVRPDLPPPEESSELIARVMDAKTGSEFLFKDMLMPYLRDSYEDLREATRGADLLVTHVITFAGPLVAEKFRIPWVSTVLSPISFWSVYDLPVPPGTLWLAYLRRLGPGVLKILLAGVKRKVFSWVEPVSQLRPETFSIWETAYYYQLGR